MKSIVAILLATCCVQAFAAELQLICEDTSDLVKSLRNMSPSFGFDVFTIDLGAPRVRQIAGMLKDREISDVSVTETDIRFTQSGSFARPTLSEFEVTTISRISGEWVRNPLYVGADGVRVQGDQLEQLAHSLDLDGFFGIQRRGSTGSCRRDDRKF